MQEINYHKHPKVSFKYTPNLIFLLCFRVESRESFGERQPKIYHHIRIVARLIFLHTDEQNVKICSLYS